MRTILITGGSGFLGEELISRLHQHKVRVVARNEGKLIELKHKFPDIEIITGDIADRFICQKALKGIETVYHLAAFKHVGLAETQSYECTKTNIHGTVNLLDMFEGRLFVAISTDKAAQMAGVYGASKYIMEKLIEEHSHLKTYTTYRVVRYGNVLYSTGSVLCKWKDLMQQGKEVIVTDPAATRFFWTIDQAVDLIFDCVENAPDARPWVPQMKAMSVGNLLEAMMQKYGRVPVKQIGLQPGENLDETMDGKTFSNEVEQYTIEEIAELI